MPTGSSKTTTLRLPRPLSGPLYETTSTMWLSIGTKQALISGKRSMEVPSSPYPANIELWSREMPSRRLLRNRAIRTQMLRRTSSVSCRASGCRRPVTLTPMSTPMMAERAKTPAPSWRLSTPLTQSSSVMPSPFSLAATRLWQIKKRLSTLSGATRSIAVSAKAGPLQLVDTSRTFISMASLGTSPRLRPRSSSSTLCLSGSIRGPSP